MNLEKICNLYASDLHFCTILMSFIDKNIEAGKQVINIFENDLEPNMKTIIEKTKLQKELKDNLLKIEWNKKDIDINFGEELKDFADEKEKLIFINGAPEYIKTMNENIEEWINKNRLNKGNVKIIHCYNIEQIQDNISNIVNLYPKILDTTGEHSTKKFYSYI